MLTGDKPTTGLDELRKHLDDLKDAVVPPLDYRTAEAGHAAFQADLRGYAVSAATKCRKVYQHLKRKGYGSANVMDYTSGDGEAWFMALKDHEVFAVTNQNLSFFIVLQTAPMKQIDLCVYRFYKPLSDADPDYFKNPEAVMEHLDYIAQYYSDDMVSRAPVRPTFDTIWADLQRDSFNVTQGNMSYRPLLRYALGERRVQQHYTRELNDFFMTIENVAQELKQDHA